MKNCRRAAALLLCCLLMVPLFSFSAKADIVTDTLTVKVGYFGMDPDDYVEVATFEWWELEETLRINEVAYSFFRSGTGEEPRTVVASGRGFYISDLLNHCKIFMGDVASISFYTKDKTSGSFVTFSKNDLFGGRRYYFENLAKNLKPIYDENGKFVTYDDSSAWNYATVVEPMLTLEDNWTNYEIRNYETPPNFESMSAGNRFRLLFGQREPLGVETGKSAKYVHSVLVTFSGTAIYCEDPPELDGTIGSHTVTMDVTVSNDQLLEALQGLMEFTSTDGTVMQVTGWSIVRNYAAEDLVTVEISYEVLKEGDASITGSIGGASGTTVPIVATGSTAPEKLPEQPAVPEGGTGGESDGSSSDNGSGGTTDDDAENEAGGQPNVTVTNTPGLKVQLEDSDRQPESISEAVQVRVPQAIPLSAELAQMLMQTQRENIDPDGETTADAGEVRDAAEIPVEEEDYTSLLLTGIAMVLIAVTGGLSAAWTYRKEKGTVK